MKSGVEIEESAPRFSSTDSVRTAIGQGTSGFTTVQLARYATCIANSGDNYQLSIVDRVEDKKGNLLLKVEPELTSQLEMSNDYWDAIHMGMRGVVTDSSTAAAFKGLVQTLAGKTGTAQEDKNRSNHSNFIGYAPYELPDIAFACTIRNGGSSIYAAETTRKCLDYYYGNVTLEEILESGAAEIELQKVTD